MICEIYISISKLKTFLLNNSLNADCANKIRKTRLPSLLYGLVDLLQWQALPNQANTKSYRGLLVWIKLLVQRRRRLAIISPTVNTIRTSHLCSVGLTLEALIFLWKPGRPKKFFQFEIIKNVLFSFFRFIWIPIICHGFLAIRNMLILTVTGSILVVRIWRRRTSDSDD